MNWDPILLGRTVALVALNLLVVYPIWAYAQNVMHTRAIVLLSVTLLVFTASSLVEQFTPYVALAEGIHAVPDLTLLGALYLFAREFVGTDDDAVIETPAGSRRGGGFEDADD